MCPAEARATKHLKHPFKVLCPALGAINFYHPDVIICLRACWSIAAVLFPCTSLNREYKHTVVRKCCKGDDASQWENGKFDPLPRPNPLTDRHRKLRTSLRHVYLPTCKILNAIPPGVSFPRMHEFANQNVYSASFLGSSNDLQPIDI